MRTAGTFRWIARQGKAANSQSFFQLGRQPMGKNQLELSRKQETLRNQMARILIVEDEPNMVAGLRDNFEFEGYDVITAGDGGSGVGRGVGGTPPFVLLGVMIA